MFRPSVRRHLSRFSFLLLALLAQPASADSTSTAPTPQPCAAPEHRQFDFWIGDWDVRTPDGKPAGTNRIERIAKGCGLLENWTGAGGGIGKSLNYYFPDDRKWHQTWVGSWDSFLTLAGGLEEGRMVLTGETKKPDGGTQLERITWTPQADGSVRQHWQQSTDGGKTWSDAFVGVYRRKSK